MPQERQELGFKFDGLVSKFFYGHFLKTYVKRHKIAKTNISFDIQILKMKNSI